MNVETAFILSVIAVAGYLFWRSRNKPVPEPTYSASVRVRPDRSAPFVAAAIVLVWLAVQLLRAVGVSV